LTLVAARAYRRRRGSLPLTQPLDPRAAFVTAAVGHGPLDEAEALLAAQPGLATSDVHTAAILGDVAAVRGFLAADPSCATAKAAPHGWDALTHLCFSRYLRLNRSRAHGFLDAARALLDAGASAATGYRDEDHEPEPAWESALYGAAGLARDAELTRLLLERGADPNDDETPYHAPETHDNGVVEVLLASGRLSPDSLATMLLRKCDWHDQAGVRLLLEHGADPKRFTRWGYTALHQALRRDNALETVALLLDHGADPGLLSRGSVRDPRPATAVAIAARRGRGDVLSLLERRGVPLGLEGPLRLVAACARGDEARARELLAREPGLVAALAADAGPLLAGFAGVGNAAGIALLLDLGLDVNARSDEEDGYWQLGPGSTALHAAAWRARHATVQLLIERGALVGARDGRGRTPLALAVRACVDSYWTELRSPETVRRLLAAGATTDGVPQPSGYAEVDALVAASGR